MPSLASHALPPGYVLRHPEAGEEPAIQSVLDAAETADTGEPRRHENDVATEWMSEECHPADDWWVAVTADGTVVGVGWVWPQTAGEVTADHYVHPDHRGLGLGDVLLDVIEARAAELPATTADGGVRHLVVWCEETDAARLASLSRRGFSRERSYYEMSIGLDATGEAPAWPPGVEPRSFRAGLDEHALYEADLEAFAEHHLFEPRSFDEWRLFHVDAPRQDGALWRLAWDGDDLAGFVIASADDLGGSVDDLAVRKPWRGRGLGRALLLSAFDAFRVRGHGVARVLVDAQNVTNALDVYEAAGMRVSRRFAVMRRALG